MSDISDFDEEAYLAGYPDVAAAVRDKKFASGMEHYLLHGQWEGRGPNGVESRRQRLRAEEANRLDAQPPVVLKGATALAGLAMFLHDPITAMRWNYAKYGPFVIVDSPLRIFFGARHRLFALTAGARFNREVLNDPEIWRPVHVMSVSQKESAARRVGLGLFSMNGRRHAHYRELISQPLRRSNIDPGSGEMAVLADSFVDTWPVGRPFDLWRHVRDLVRNISVGLVFGDDREHAYPIADLVDKRVLFKWTLGAQVCPFNMRQTPYGKMMRQSEEIERRITEWAGCKRGQPDNRDLMSNLLNNPDEEGKPATDASVVGHVPTLFVAAYDTCQTALIWTLVLLSQHPRIACDVADELASLEGATPGIETVRELPLLDAVVKESMRLLPPVPMQFRRARFATTLGGYPVPERTRVALSSFVTNRLPDLYPEPDRFLPERWASIKPSGYEYAVFSGGPRVCPGQWFGMNVLKSSLVAILSRFRVELEPNVRIDCGVQPTLSPRSAVMATLKPKQGVFTSSPVGGGIARLVKFPE